MTEVMKLKSLHYGYWDDPNQEDIDLEVVKDAQHQYTVRLHELIPEGVSSVLDVGCGIGDNARYLASKGLSVTALSPDDNHGKFFDPSIDNPHFIQSTIEALEIEGQTFDMVLMSESQNYFGIHDGLRQVKRYLKPGGYLFISGNFLQTNSTEVYDTIHKESDYIAAAKEYGLEVVNRVDITQNVLPTLNYTKGLLSGMLVPALTIITDYLAREMPKRTKLAKMFLGGQTKRVGKILDYYDQFLDEKNYTEHVNYVRLIFQMKK